MWHQDAPWQRFCPHLGVVKNTQRVYNKGATLKNLIRRVIIMSIRDNYQMPLTMSYPHSDTVLLRQNLQAIRTLRRLEKTGNEPSDEDLHVLSTYAGYGNCSSVFDNKNKVDDLDRIVEATSDVQFTSIKRSIPYAYYTPPMIAKLVWDCVALAGFRGGRVLDPATGTGNFLSVVPADLRNEVEMVAVENDCVAGGIARQLLPKARVLQCGYQEVDPKDHRSFDLVITNVPFGQDPIFDQALAAKEHRRMLDKVHDFYLAKSLLMVRPGGLVAIITSRHFMDAQDNTVKQYVHQRARLLLGARLPRHTFGNTPVLADILIFQKRLPGETVSPDPSWAMLREVEMPGLVKGAMGRDGEYSYASARNPVKHLLNSYMVDRSIGNYLESSSRFGPEPTLEGGTLNETIAELVTTLRDIPTTTYEGEQFSCRVCGRTNWVGDYCADCGRVHRSSDQLAVVAQELEYFTDEHGAIWQRIDGKKARVHKPQKTLARLRGQLGLLPYVDNVNNAPDDIALRLATRRLALAYSRFRSEYGPLNNRANRIAINGDPRAPFLQSIEMWDEEKQTATPAEIFRRQQVRRATWPERADSLEHAVGLSLARFNMIQWGYVASLCNTTTSEAIAGLEGKVFLDPHAGWQPAEAYLSGDVVSKLDEAVAAAAASSIPGLYRSNIDALTAVQPQALTAGEIWPGLGAPWIPLEIVQQFANELLDPTSPINEQSPSKHYTPPRAIVVKKHVSWTVERNGWIDSTMNSLAVNKWGTRQASAIELLEHLLNGTRVTIFTTVDGNRVADKVETTVAREKAKGIQTAFETWLWQDPSRRADMEKLYNSTMNRWVARSWDGSHLTFPGLNPEIKLRPHQADAVWRGIQGDNLILWHRVGAGKTYTMIAMSMEMKRLKLAERPMHVVPDHLLSQYANEFYRLYPHAKLLQVSSQTLSPVNRARYLAYITSANYDAVIISHTAFKMINLNRATWEDFINRELEQLEIVLSDVDDDDRVSRRAIERSKLRLQAKLDERRYKSSKGGQTAICWESLGIDALFYDEAHHARNLHYTTRRSGVAGIGGSESGLAFDLYAKTQYMSRRCVCGRPIGSGKECGCVRNQRARSGKLVLATGTLLTNTIAEVYTFLKFTCYDHLRELGFADFDSWAANFGEMQTLVEMSPSGKGFRQYERFVRFRNVPELQTLLAIVCDVQLDAKDMGLDLPKVATGEPIIIECEPDEAQLDVFASCATRYNDLMSGKVEWGEDNVLSIMGDAGRAAIDARLVTPQAPENPSGKISTAAQKIAAIYHQTRQVVIANERHGLTQQVFLDTYGGSGPVNLYHDLINKLSAAGIPRSQIAIAQEHKTPTQKTKLQDRINSGETAVIIGSTRAMGEGWNVQRLAAVQHQIDTPWTPTGVEQREGRVLRQGNLVDEVGIYRYVTPDSLDFYRWHLLETKLRFIRQIAQANTSQRTVEDIDQTILSFAQMKAVAAGNALVLEQVAILARLQTLKMMRSKHEKGRRDAELGLASAPEVRKEYLRRLDKTRSLAQYLNDHVLPATSGEQFCVVVQGQTYNNELEARRALQSAINSSAFADKDDRTFYIGDASFRLGHYESGPVAAMDFDETQIYFELAYRSDTTWERLLARLQHFTGGRAEQNIKLDLDRLERKVAENEMVIKTPFAHQHEQEELEARLIKIETAIELEATKKHES